MRFDESDSLVYCPMVKNAFCGDLRKGMGRFILILNVVSIFSVCGIALTISTFVAEETPIVLGGD